MTCDHARRWMVMISDDLREARRHLRARPGAAEAFLRARIAEDEAILKLLKASQHAEGACELAPVPGYRNGDPAQAA
jgi:hypothetical protein